MVLFTKYEHIIDTHTPSTLLKNIEIHLYDIQPLV